MKRTLLVATVLLGLALTLTIHAVPQGTAFTYQGELSDSGHPANGTFDMTFTLFDAATGGKPLAASIIAAQYPVTGGLFSIDLDFASVFGGQQTWLEVSVGGQTLTPRQPINSVPVAQVALSVPPGLSGYPAMLAGARVAQIGPASIALLPLSGQVDVAALIAGAEGGPIPLNAIPAPQPLPQAGTFGSLHAMFVASEADSFAGGTISATLYVGSNGNPLAATALQCAVPLPPFMANGDVLTCVSAVAVPFLLETMASLPSARVGLRRRISASALRLALEDGSDKVSSRPNQPPAPGALYRRHAFAT